MNVAAAREVSRICVKTIQAKLTFAEPQTPRRTRPNLGENAHIDEVQDEDGDVHIHVTMPARLARDVEWSFQMSPRSASRITASPPHTNQSTRPVIVPLQFANAPLHRGAPPSPPPSPSPSPPSPLLRVPTVAPPRVCSF